MGQDWWTFSKKISAKQELPSWGIVI
jgi:hypothetical protein